MTKETGSRHLLPQELRDAVERAAVRCLPLRIRFGVIRYQGYSDEGVVDDMLFFRNDRHLPRHTQEYEYERSPCPAEMSLDKVCERIQDPVSASDLRSTISQLTECIMDHFFLRSLGDNEASYGVIEIDFVNRVVLRTNFVEEYNRHVSTWVSDHTGPEGEAGDSA